MVEQNFQPYIGKSYKTTRLLLISESVYSWLENDQEQTPTRSHPEKSVNHWIDNFPKGKYFAAITRALCGTERPTLPERKQAWNQCAYSIYVQDPLGLGAHQRPTLKQFKNSGPAFLKLIEKLQPAKVIITGKQMWNLMPECHVELTPDLQAYELKNGSLVWCLALPHPSSRTKERGFDWKKAGKSIRIFKSLNLPANLDGLGLGHS